MWCLIPGHTAGCHWFPAYSPYSDICRTYSSITKVYGCAIPQSTATPQYTTVYRCAGRTSIHWNMSLRCEGMALRGTTRPVPASPHGWRGGQAGGRRALRRRPPALRPVSALGESTIHANREGGGEGLGPQAVAAHTRLGQGLRPLRRKLPGDPPRWWPGPGVPGAHAAATWVAGATNVAPPARGFVPSRGRVSSLPRPKQLRAGTHGWMCMMDP